jgi:hypothetical protein
VAPSDASPRKPGASAEQVARDEVDYAARAAASGQRTATVAAAEREAVDTCMRGRGYTRQAGR